MVMVETPPLANHIDAIGGVHCRKCGKPMLRITMKNGEPVNLPAVLWRLCKCGEYNVVDLERS